VPARLVRPNPSMRLTLPRLKDISRQITDGNPWWGMVVANEYLDPSSPIHRALVTTFTEHIGGELFEPELAIKLISGCRFEDLSDLLKSRLGARPTPRFRRNFNPQTFDWLRSRRRVAKSYRLPVDHRKLRGFLKESFLESSDLKPSSSHKATTSGRRVGALRNVARRTKD